MLLAYCMVEPCSCNGEVTVHSFEAGHVVSDAHGACVRACERYGPVPVYT